MALSKEVAQGLVAGAFGLIGTLSPVVLNWLRERDVASARMRKLDEATRRIAFWDQWLKLSIQLPDQANATAIELVRRELDLLSEIVRADSLAIQHQVGTQQDHTNEFTNRVRNLGFFRRVMLFYRPARSLAWFPRLLFYLGIWFMVFFILVMLTEHSTIEGFLIVESMVVAWMVVFRGLSQWLEQPRESTILSAASPRPR